MSESPTGLQNLIHGLENFCSQWHLVVNLTKTKAVVFNNKLGNDAFPFVFNDNDVPISKQYNYLGVIFSDEKTTNRNMVRFYAQSMHHAISYVM